MTARLLRGVRIVGSLSLAAWLTACAVEPVREAETIRVLSYNIHMWQIGVDDLADIVRAADADVVGLNEAWDAGRNDAIAEELGYHIVYGGMDPAQDVPAAPHSIRGYYMPQVLLTKHTIVHSEVFNAMAAKEHEAFDPEVPIYRGGTLALLETAGGSRFVVFVLHLHPWGDGANEKMTSMRLAEMEGILGKLEPYRELPIVILGDFNTRSHADGNAGWKVTRCLAENGFRDLYREVHPDPETAPGLTCGDGRIDYVFLNEFVTPIDCQVVTSGVFGSRGYEQSDHLAVFGAARLQDPRR